MAARYPEAAAVVPTHTPRHVTLPELERALQQLTLEVAEQKQELADTFRHIHQIVSQREVELVAQLDAIPAGISAKIEERRASLEQLTQHKEEAERKLQANRLNEFLQKQLSVIRTEMDKILSEQILFPRVSIRCDLDVIRTQLENYCFVRLTNNPYIIRTLPVWHGVKGENELYYPSAICIDSTTQLIYVGEATDTGRVQVFTKEGKHLSTLHNQQLEYCRSIKMTGDYIYVSCSLLAYYLIKLNKKGETIKRLTTDAPITGIFTEDRKLYTCTLKSLTVQVYDLNLKPSKKIQLKAISFADDTYTCEIMVDKQQLFVLFTNNYHPDPIQIFRLDGTIVRSLVPGNLIKKALHFCMDSYENILVSDSGDHCIRIFSPDGILFKCIGREGDREPGELRYPRGITMDSQGLILIVDGKDDNVLQAF